MPDGNKDTCSSTIWENGINKMLRKPKGNSIIDNPDISNTRDKRETKKKNHNTTHTETDEQYGPQQKPGVPM